MTEHTPRTRVRTVQRWTLPVLALLLTASGCSWFGGDDDTAPAAGASPAPVEQPEAPVEVIGADVEVGDPVDAPEVGQGVYFVSDLYEVSGQRLSEPVLVRMVLDSALPEGTPLAVAARDGEDRPWRFVEGQLDADGTHVEFIVSQLATFGVLAIDGESIASRLGTAIDTVLEEDASAPAGVEAPTCADADAATKDGYTATSWKRKTVAWCLDASGDDHVLRLTNRRGVPVRVTAPGAAERATSGDATRAGIDWDSWTSAVAAAPAVATDASTDTSTDTSGDDSPGADTVLAPGESLELDADLDPGSSLLVTAADDARSRSVQVLHAAARSLSAQVKDFGLVPAKRVPGGERVLGELLAAEPCAQALGQAPRALARRCLGPRALTRVFGAQGLLLAPALQPRPTAQLLGERLTSLETAAERVEQRIEVTRDTPDFGALVGRFSGTGRSIVVSADGLVTESYGTADGPVVTLGYQLSDPTMRPKSGTATATVTSVQVLDRKAARGLGVPQVGQAGVLTLAPGGVLSAPFLGGTYCDATAAGKGKCTDAPATSTSALTKPRPSAPRSTPAAGGR